MEDVEKEGVGEGVDVRGLVGWDDGLSRGERERLSKGGEGRVVDEASPVREVEAGLEPLVLQGEVGVREVQQVQQQEFKRERKPLRKWLGIW